MEKYTIRLATKELFQRYLNEFNLTNNLKELSIEAIDKINDYPIDKLSRWLGFVQGYIIFTNQSTIDIERDFSRPLFHKAYENENIQVFVVKSYFKRQKIFKLDDHLYSLRIKIMKGQPPLLSSILEALKTAMDFCLNTLKNHYKKGNYVYYFIIY